MKSEVVSRKWLACVAMLALGAAADEEFRTWTYYGGRTVEARVLKRIGSDTLIMERPDGTRLAVSRSFLTEQDRHYLETGEERVAPAMEEFVQPEAGPPAEEAPAVEPVPELEEPPPPPEQPAPPQPAPDPEAQAQTRRRAAREAGLSMREARRLGADMPLRGSSEGLEAGLAADRPPPEWPGPVTSARDVEDLLARAGVQAEAKAVIAAHTGSGRDLAAFSLAYVALRRQGHSHAVAVRVLRELTRRTEA